MGFVEKLYIYVLVAIFIDTVIQQITGMIICGLGNLAGCDVLASGVSVSKLIVGIVNVSTGTDIVFGAPELLFLVFWAGVLLVIYDLQKGRVIKT